MAKDLIIGGASNYTWDQLKYWVNSIRKSGFKGDVVLTGTNYTKETIDKLSKEGVLLNLYGKKKENGDIEAPTNNAPHVERFFYLWNYLAETKEDYRYVITTDTKDVIFQSNPSTWLENNLRLHSLVCSLEGMKFKGEPWNNQNFDQTFGPFFHKLISEKHIINVGVIAGETKIMKTLLILLFQMSINRPIPIVDQAVFNFIIRNTHLESETYFTTNTDSWAIQLATSEEAVKARSGDLGIIYGENPTKLLQYKMNFEDIQPVLKTEGVFNNKDEKYAIVHQYDRIPVLKQAMQKLYGDL